MVWAPAATVNGVVEYVEYAVPVGLKVLTTRAVDLHLEVLGRHS